MRTRKARGLSQEALAHDAEVDRTWISRLETSKAAVSVDVIEKVARALGVDPSDLLRSGG
ncbi:helix-turn-helix transcriptional regulator [Phenylobacterium sp.]|uniref:helix-turn-helix domain-containing protein n=1 Tax=Phenylobacterium sp. TaxID=1871053 RepID=UPI0025F14202|nr:helix-turn-helix transcriptional regulator [Phenylobacterium sp.]